MSKQDEELLELKKSIARQTAAIYNSNNNRTLDAHVDAQGNLYFVERGEL